MTKILLLGKDGQVGWELQRSLAPLGNVVALGREACDLSNTQRLRELIRAEKPQVIVNAAAYTAVDKAETESALCTHINADAPAAMAEAARALGALLVHYSTDYVFDGRKAQAYVETDAPNPQSVYGRSKLAGEQAIAASGCRALIFRTSWVFGVHGNNFVKTILRLASAGRALRIVDDQIGSPTPAALIADVTGLALATRQRFDDWSEGTRLYHLTAAKPVSWCGFARTIIDYANRTPGFPALPTAESITPIGTTDYPLPAPRPANSQLDCARLETDFALTMPDWRPYLARFLPLLPVKKNDDSIA
jgi:dTDP-4-dehydrorhamnose reductase